MEASNAPQEDFRAAIWQHSEVIQEDFINLVIAEHLAPCKQRARTLMWELYQQIRTAITHFLKTQLHAFFANEGAVQPEDAQTGAGSAMDTEEARRARRVKGAAPCAKKHAVSDIQQYRESLKNLLTRLSEKNLTLAFKQLLLRTIVTAGDDSAPACEFKNRKHAIRARMVSLILYVYVHTREAQRNVFNIFSVWAHIYPNKPLWKLRVPPNYMAPLRAGAASGSDDGETAIVGEEDASVPLTGEEAL